MSATPETGYWAGAITYTPALGPVAAIHFGEQDADGTCWVLQDFSGLDGPDTAGQVVQRAGDHGAFAPPQWYAARNLTLTLMATGLSQSLRDDARAALQRAVPVGDGGAADLALLRIDEPTPKQMWVRRSGTLPESYPTLFDVVFTVGLVAPDPRKYSAALHTAAVNAGPPAPGLAPPWTPPITLPPGAPPMSVSCTNAGSFETRPTVTVQGPVVGPRIVNQVTGQTVGYSSLTLGPTDQLVVDFLNKRAEFNGAFRPADLTSAWWVMPPGATGVQLLGSASAGASMTVAWRDAWI